MHVNQVWNPPTWTMGVRVSGEKASLRCCWEVVLSNESFTFRIESVSRVLRSNIRLWLSCLCRNCRKICKTEDRANISKCLLKNAALKSSQASLNPGIEPLTAASISPMLLLIIYRQTWWQRWPCLHIYEFNIKHNLPWITACVW